MNKNVRSMKDLNEIIDFNKETIFKGIGILQLIGSIYLGFGIVFVRSYIGWFLIAMALSYFIPSGLAYYIMKYEKYENLNIYKLCLLYLIATNSLLIVLLVFSIIYIQLNKKECDKQELDICKGINNLGSVATIICGITLLVVLGSLAILVSLYRYVSHFINNKPIIKFQALKLESN